MKKIIIFCVIFLTALYQNLAIAQTQQVQGTVSDKSGPVPGASVAEKGVSGNAVSTDENGRFRIALKGTSNTLLITGVGYIAREVKIAGQSSLKITLQEDNKTLDEVIVVGYNTQQKKVTLTGSASAISGPSIRKNTSASIQNGLVGKLPGFFAQQRTGRPGNDATTFYIRGVSSPNEGTNTPLVMVDDVEFTYEQLQRLDPNEVESITILKDASTTAIYGVRGANGVLLVTTRRGKTGPATISAKTEFTASQFTILPTYLDSYNSALLQNQAQINDNALAPVATFKPQWSDEDLELFKNGQDPYGHPNVNWKEALFKDYGSQYRTNLDVQGGTEKLKYFVSLGYINQGGQTRNYSKNQEVNGNFYHQRYNYRSNLDIGITKDLSMRFDLAGNYGEINQPSIYTPSINGNYNDPFYEYTSFYSLAPWAYPIKNPDGSWGYSNWQKTIGGGQYNAGNIIQRLTEFGYRRNIESNITLNASAVEKLNFITPGLSVKGTLAYTSNYGYYRSMSRQTAPSFIYNQATNTYAPRDNAVYDTPPLGLSYDPRFTYRALTAQAFLNYDRTFKKHHVTGMILYSRDSKTAQSADANFNFIPNNYLGYTASIGYDYKQKYLFQVNGAYNGSDRFDKSKRYGFFPAVSAGWNVAEEGFVKKNLEWLNQFKIRSSYGEVGQDKLPPGILYSYLQVYSPNNGIAQGDFGTQSTPVSGIQEGSLANNVTWERERKFDVGVDFSLLRSRISGTVDYFFNKRSDIITRRGTVSQIFGQDLAPINLTRTQNKGYEFELTYRDKIGKDFNFTLKGMYSLAENKILFQDEPDNPNRHQLYTGQSIGQVLIYKWDGFYSQEDLTDPAIPKPAGSVRAGDLRYADIAGNPDGSPDGKITEADRGFFAKPNLPSSTYSFQLGAGFKGFSFNVVFQGAANFNLRTNDSGILPFATNFLPIHQQSWTPELGNNAKLPLLTQNYNASSPQTYLSDFWYRSGNYLRLRTAEVSYTLPGKVTNKLKLQGIRLYANGNNLYTWSKLFNIYQLDPEATNGSTLQRMDYPPSKLYNMGISVTF